MTRSQSNSGRLCKSFTCLLLKRTHPPHSNTNHASTHAQADVFRHRLRATIYSFECEEEMLGWISVFNQAVSVVIHKFGIPRVQFHDWHGTLALQV